MSFHLKVFSSALAFVKMSPSIYFTGQESPQLLNPKRHKQNPQDKVDEPLRVDSITSTGLRAA